MKLFLHHEELIQLYMMEKNKIRILIVDDHPFVRMGITKIIEKDEYFKICGEAESVNEALLIIKKSDPHVVLLDISLNQSNGLDLIRIVSEIHPLLPILVISMHDESVYVEKALQAGAKGYILKRESVQLVPKAIYQLLEGKSFISEIVSQTLLNQFSTSQNTVDPKTVLSEREWEIYQLLGQGKVRHTISDDLGISVRTVDTHFDRIKTKLGYTSVSQIICAAAKQRN